MEILGRMIAEYQPGSEPRLVVLSQSAGLAVASRWVQWTEQEVHALVDWEGGADSVDRTGVLDVLLESGGITTWPGNGSTLAETWIPDIGTWEDLIEANNFYFRPPRQLLDVPGWLPQTHTGILQGILDAWEAAGTWVWKYSTWEKVATNDEARYWDYWHDWYAAGGAYRTTMLKSWLLDFWAEREPIVALASFRDRQVAYVRIQYAVDHEKAGWYSGWHAIKALNAAYDGGRHPHVYYFDNSTWGGTPVNMTGAFDEDAVYNVVDKKVDGWPEWSWILQSDIPGSHYSSFEVSWPIMVHAVRWCMNQSF